MATQAEIDAVEALIEAGQFDQARAQFRAAWDHLFLDYSMRRSLRGSKPKHLENLGIAESWNLHLNDSDDFGANATHLHAVPDVDQAPVILPVTTLFVPEKGYRWTIKNGSSVNRLLVDPDGAATIDGAATLNVEPQGTVELVFEGVAGRELTVVASSAVDRFQRIPLVAADGAAGLLSWQNPFGADLIVRMLVDLTTPASGAHTADFGQAATAVTSDNLLDGVDLGTAAGLFTSVDHYIANQVPNGRTFQRVAAGEFVTGTTSTGAAAGLVGVAHVDYRFT